MSKEVGLLKEELAKKDIRIKELEEELEADCCADNCQEVAMLQAKIDELEHRHQSLMKALDEGEILDKLLTSAKPVLCEKTNKGEWIISKPEVIAKAITDFIKSKLTGGERWR